MLYATRLEGLTSSDIFGIQPGPDAASVPLVTSRFSDTDPALSPNGQWLAYSSEGGLFVVPFPNTGDARWPVSGGISGQPVWSSDGTELFYVTFNAAFDSLTLYVAEVDTKETFSVVATEAISIHPATTFFGGSYAVAPDNQRLLVMETGPGREGELILVQNFFEELKARVGR